MNRLSLILIALLCLGIVGYIVFEFYVLRNANVSAANRAFIKEKIQKIENELTHLCEVDNFYDHPWAGWYYYGDGLGTNVDLLLAPENGFTITSSGCLGLYDQNHGTADWDGNIVKLSSAWKVHKIFESEYRPIRWGERIYLIANDTDAIVRFCNAVNSRREPRDSIHGSFFLRHGAVNWEVEGKPEIPEEFMPYLLDEPVNAVIVSVKNTTTFVVDKGKNDGLLPGMELYIIEQDDIFGWMELTTIEETQSEGTISCYSFSGRNKKPVPQPGWQLSTSQR